MKRILTVYFSHKGENYFPDGIKVISKGNTEIAAEFIVNTVGGDLFEIDGKSMKKIKKDLCANYYMFKDIMMIIDEINTILSQDNVISIRQGYWYILK